MKRILIVSASITLAACSSKSPKDNPVLVEANQIYLEAEAIQAEIEPQIERVDSLKNLLKDQKSAEADSLVNELSKVKANFEDWEKNFFDVPGFEHNHEKGDKHHHHNHTPAPKLPADKMLEVQKEIKTNIESIRSELNQTLVRVKETLK